MCAPQFFFLPFSLLLAVRSPPRPLLQKEVSPGAVMYWYRYPPVFVYSCAWFGAPLLRSSELVSLRSGVAAEYEQSETARSARWLD